MQPVTPMPSMGILHVQASTQKFALTRHAPSEDLSPFVKHYWIVNWDLTGQDPYVQHTVPNPCVNLIFEPHTSAFYGLAKQKNTKQLEGASSAFGVKFKPGGFYPFVKWPVSALTNRSIELDEVFNIDVSDFQAKLFSASSPEDQIEMVEHLLRQHLPEPDPTANTALQMVEYIQDNRDITKVDEVCEHFQINKRTMQRIFNQYVGVSPKWVIRLSRLQNAAETIDRCSHQDLLQLTTDLGYFDQSHFIKDFKSIIGQTPEAYMKL
ncbi:helix-turn-helix domain-containing protein [Paenibacillus sp. N1-5-1-14]|uniref:helix-turn-helix domain-containing protein n=1 Tax=Paenibacillus radicibacter TaxID=2972488 RepID=UPI0021594627|nr:helix-turn-helix domain-containing protein [Paenibacillus radicibacter]MCR8643449.1 helix-turn-helix domain-containing protein [Paenibacillus radicibacter]